MPARMKRKKQKRSLSESALNRGKLTDGPKDLEMGSPQGDFPSMPNSPRDGPTAEERLAECKKLKEKSNFVADWKDEKVRAEVLCYLKEVMRFESDLVDDDWVEKFLRKRWINRKRYTVNGCDQVFTVEEMAEVLPDPLAMLKAINTKILGEYQPHVENLVESFDIYKLPSLNLQLMDSEQLARDHLKKLGAKHLTKHLDNVRGGLMDVAKGAAKNASKRSASMVGVEIDLDSVFSLDHKAQIRNVFDEMDIDNNGSLDIDEWMTAAKILKDNGFDIDLDGDGKIVEEAEALFHIMDANCNGRIAYAEFEDFVIKAEEGIHRLAPEGSVFSVWDDNSTFLMVYVLFGMAIITQFFVPLNVFFLYMNGMLGDMGDMCREYPMDSCEWTIVEDWAGAGPAPLVERTDEFMETFSQFVLETDNGMLWGMCPAMVMQHLDPDTGGTLAVGWLPRLGAMFLFIFLQVSTPIGDAYNACAYDKMPKDYDTLAYSYMTEDVVFYRISWTINLFCYVIIMMTTYLLFITGPSADNLLLNSIALQFLIEVDDLCYQAVMTDHLRHRLVQKFMLCYIQNGEKPKSIIEESKTGEAVKGILNVVIGTYLGYISACLYWITFVLPGIIYVCII